MSKTLRTRAQRALLTVLVASRNEAGLTQRDLAERLGRPHSFVSKVESGERELRYLEFMDWAAALKVDPIVLTNRFLSWYRT